MGTKLGPLSGPTAWLSTEQMFGQTMPNNSLPNTDSLTVDLSTETSGQRWCDSGPAYSTLVKNPANVGVFFDVRIVSVFHRVSCGWSTLYMWGLRSVGVRGPPPCTFSAVLYSLLWDSNNIKKRVCLKDNPWMHLAVYRWTRSQQMWRLGEGILSNDMLCLLTFPQTL